MRECEKGRQKAKATVDMKPSIFDLQYLILCNNTNRSAVK